MSKSASYTMALGAFIVLCSTAINATANEITVDQQNKSFVKDGTKIAKLSINVGDAVRFKNEDPFFHNIFSLSELKSFDLGSFPKGEFKVVTFDKAGVIEVECAIHPEMFMEITVK